jgi:GntR family transcriptional regulator
VRCYNQTTNKTIGLAGRSCGTVTSPCVNPPRPATGHLTSRIRDDIGSRIARGELHAGQQLPTERELSKSFAVSRVTVRRALGILADDGLVYAVQGKGTYVASQRLAEPPNALLSFHDMVANDNVVVGAEPLRMQVRAASLSEAELFGIAPGAELFELERLRTLDGLPVAIDSNVLPLALDPALPDLDWAYESLYTRLAAAGHGPVSADYAVEARPADGGTARLLATDIGSPLLVAESRAFDSAGRLVVSGLISYRGDRYRFRSTLTAQQQRPFAGREAARL